MFIMIIFDVDYIFLRRVLLSYMFFMSMLFVFMFIIQPLIVHTEKSYCELDKSEEAQVALEWLCIHQYLHTYHYMFTSCHL